MKKIFIIAALFFAPVSYANAYTVAYNVKTGIYHDTNCKWARKCTRNCIKTDHTDAIRRGARACHVCGG